MFQITAGLDFPVSVRPRRRHRHGARHLYGPRRGQTGLRFDPGHCLRKSRLMDACNVGEGRLQFQDGYTNAIGHLFLVSVLPYLIPFAAMIYPVIVTFRALRNAQTSLEDAEDLDPEDELRKDDLRYVFKSPSFRLSTRETTCCYAVHDCSTSGRGRHWP